MMETFCLTLFIWDIEVFLGFQRANAIIDHTRVVYEKLKIKIKVHDTKKSNLKRYKANIFSSFDDNILMS